MDCGKVAVTEGSNNEELEAKIDSMIEIISEGDKKFKCTVCGKGDKFKAFIKRHVETHIEGVSHVCNLCGKVSRSRKGLIDHHSKYHTKQI